MKYDRYTSREWAKNKYAVESYKRLAELEDKIEQGELVSKEWHDEQILHAEQEIERLRNEKWDAQDDLDCYHSEMKNEIKQAQIEVLEQVKQLICDNTYPAFDMAGKPVSIWNTDGYNAIDNLIAELKGETE